MHADEEFSRRLQALLQHVNLPQQQGLLQSIKRGHHARACVGIQGFGSPLRRSRRRRRRPLQRLRGSRLRTVVGHGACSVTTTRHQCAVHAGDGVVAAFFVLDKWRSRTDLVHVLVATVLVHVHVRGGAQMSDANRKGGGEGEGGGSQAAAMIGDAFTRKGEEARKGGSWGEGRGGGKGGGHGGPGTEDGRSEDEERGRVWGEAWIRRRGLTRRRR